MSWILPSKRTVLRAIGVRVDRHRPGYWKEYRARRLLELRAYQAKWNRDRRAAA